MPITHIIFFDIFIVGHDKIIMLYFVSLYYIRTIMFCLTSYTLRLPSIGRSCGVHLFVCRCVRKSNADAQQFYEGFYVLKVGNLCTHRVAHITRVHRNISAQCNISRFFRPRDSLHFHNIYYSANVAIVLKYIYVYVCVCKEFFST